MLGSIFHPLVMGDAASEGAHTVLMMLAAGSVFILVIAIGELSHHVAQARRRRKS